MFRHYGFVLDRSESNLLKIYMFSVYFLLLLVWERMKGVIPHRFDSSRLHIDHTENRT